MAFEINIEYGALEELQEKLCNVDTKLKWEIRVKLEEAAAMLKETAQQFAPARTGYLRSTIYAHGQDEEILFGAAAPYALYLEYGTSRIKPKRFLTRALEALLPSIISMLNEAVEKSLQEATGT